MPRHGLHRPNRCCIECHEEDLSYTGHAERGGPYSVERPFQVPSTDPGPRRALAAKMQTSENAGDRW